MPTCSISIQERAECGYVVFIIGCPGCGANHVFMVGNDDPKRNWTFNGNLKRPTFKPSMLAEAGSFVCHFYLTDGAFIFQKDCTHGLRGKTVACEWVVE